MLNFEGPQTSPKQRRGRDVFPPLACCPADGAVSLAALRGGYRVLCRTSQAAVDAGRAVLPHRREGAVWAVGRDWQERSSQSGLYKKSGEPQKRGKACMVALWLSFVLYTVLSIAEGMSLFYFS